MPARLVKNDTSSCRASPGVTRKSYSNVSCRDTINVRRIFLATLSLLSVTVNGATEEVSEFTQISRDIRGAIDRSGRRPRQWRNPMDAMRMQASQNTEMIGEGGYGKVFKRNGKCVKQSSMPSRSVMNMGLPFVEFQFRAMMRENWLQTYFSHPNVMGLTENFPVPRSIHEEGFVERGDVERGTIKCLATTEVLDGDLQKLVIKYREERKPMPVTVIVEMLHQILQGISYLHKAQIIHRDIKPHNILYKSRINDDGNTIFDFKITDFGFSRYIGENQDGRARALTQPEQFTMQTPPYRSPEMMRDPWTAPCPDHERYSCKLDMWSIGSIILYMLVNMGTDCSTRTPAYDFGPEYRDDPQYHYEYKRFIDRCLPRGQSNVETRKKFLFDWLKTGNIRQGVKRWDLKLEHPIMDLLARLMDSDPKTRISAQDALKHTTFTKLSGDYDGDDDDDEIDPESEFDTMEAKISNIIKSFKSEHKIDHRSHPKHVLPYTPYLFLEGLKLLHERYEKFHVIDLTDSENGTD